MKETELLESDGEVFEYALHCIHQKGCKTYDSANFGYGKDRAAFELCYVSTGLRIQTKLTDVTTRRPKYVVITYSRRKWPSKEDVRHKVDAVYEKLLGLRRDREAAVKRMREEQEAYEARQKEQRDRLEQATKLLRRVAGHDEDTPMSAQHIIDTKTAVGFVAYGYKWGMPTFGFRNRLEHLTEQDRADLIIATNKAIAEVVAKYQ